MDIESKLNQYFIDLAEELSEEKGREVSVEEAKKTIRKDWGYDGLRGYGVFVSSSSDVQHIEKIDEMNIYDSDLDAAKQAEIDGIKIIHDINIPEDSYYYPYKDTIIDTETNRKMLSDELKKER